MLSGKYVGLATIIDKVYRDNGFTIDIDPNDIAEWTAELIGLMDIPLAYKKRITDGNDADPIVIENFRGELPCDLYSIQQTRHCNGTPMRYTTDSFHRKLHATNCPDITCSSEYTYSLNDNYIFTNFKEGQLEMSYYAFMTDDQGYPMIPDNAAFIQAVATHVAERIGFRLFIQGKISPQIYQLLSSERAFYVKSAEVGSHVPNRDRTESIKNAFIRLVPNNRHHASGYKNLGSPQIIYNHNP